MRLIVFCGSRKFDVPLEVGRDLTVGRGSRCDVVIPERKASRQHCKLIWEGERLVILDEGSSNGTQIGGARLLTNRPFELAHNDRIEIGEAAIIVDCALWEARGAARPVVPEAEVTPEAASPATVTPGTGAPVARPRSRRRTTTLVSGLLGLATAAALALALVAGYQYLRERAACQEEYATARSMERSGNLEVARDMYAAFRQAHPTSELARLAHERQSEIESSLRREEEALDGLADLEAEAARLSWSPSQFSRRLEELIQRYGDTRSGARLKSTRDQLRQQVLEERELAFSQTSVAVQLALEEGNYSRALQLLREFSSAYDPGPFRKEMERTELAIKSSIQDGAGPVLGRVIAAIKEQQFDQARDLCVANLPRFGGTPVASQLRQQLFLIDILVRERDLGVAQPDVGVAQAEVDERAGYLARLEELDTAMRDGNFTEAGSLLEALATMGGPDARAELAWRRTGLEAELGLHAKLQEAASNGEFRQSSRHIEHGGMTFELTAFDGDKPVFSLIDEGKAKSRITGWMGLENEERVALYRKLRLEPLDLIGLANYCFRLGLDELGESGGPGQEALITACRRDASWKPEADRFLAGWRRMEVPPDGFQAYQRDFLLTRLECGDQDILKEARKQVRRLRDQFRKHGEKGVGERAVTWGKLLVARDEARPHIQSRIASMVTDEMLEYRRERVETLRRVTQLPAKQQLLLTQLKEQIEAAREHALELIYDEVAYPYDRATGNHGEEAQPEVDERVKAVRDIWQNPFSGGKVDPAVKIVTAEVRELETHLREFDPDIIEKEIAELGEDFDLDFISSLADKALNIRTFCPTKADRKLYEYNVQAMEDNATLPTIATDFEREQVRILNEYRIMMGRKAVRICDQLVMAARRHSEYMASSGKFDHVIPGHPDGATPGERCAKQGYSAGVSENIAMGQGSPQGAHNGWYNSSGHHRNMLSASWTVMGTGNSGSHWTQNFGSAPCGELPEQPPEEDEGERPRR